MSGTKVNYCLSMTVSLQCRCNSELFYTLWNTKKKHRRSFNPIAANTSAILLLFIFEPVDAFFITLYFFMASVWPTFPTTSKSMVYVSNILLFERMRTIFFVHASRSSRALALLTRSLSLLLKTSPLNRLEDMKSFHRLIELFL